jgi:hypothetical protein
MKTIIVYELPESASEEDYIDQCNRSQEDVKGLLKGFIVIVSKGSKVTVYQPITLKYFWYKLRVFFGLNAKQFS